MLTFALCFCCHLPRKKYLFQLQVDFPLKSPGRSKYLEQSRMPLCTIKISLSAFADSNMCKSSDSV